jgi:hypothetical protein
VVARAVNEVWLRDVDADGDLDLLALLKGEFRLDQSDAADDPFEGAGLLIIYNDAGQLSVDGLVEIAMPAGTELFDAAPINLDTDARPEIAILTGSGGYVADFDEESSSYLLSDSPIIPDVRNGRIEVADFDENGLDDMAITDDHDLYVNLAKGAGPLGVVAVDSLPGEENGGDQ